MPILWNSPYFKFFRQWSITKRLSQEGLADVICKLLDVNIHNRFLSVKSDMS